MAISRPLPIGISTASLFMRYATEDAVSLIGRMDVPVCEVMFNAPSEYTPEFAMELRRRLDSSGLRVHSLHVLTTRYEPMLFSEHTRQFQDAMTEFRQVCAAGRSIGASVYVMHGQAFLKHARDIDRYHYVFLAGRFRLLCEIAGEYEITIALENVFWCTYSRPGFAARLLEHDPGGIGFTLDIKQAALSGYDPTEYLAEMGSRLCNVHLCDYDNTGKLLLPGQGNADFPALFDMLYSIGYQGPCLLEVYEDSYHSPEQLQECTARLAAWSDQAWRNRER